MLRSCDIMVSYQVGPIAPLDSTVLTQACVLSAITALLVIG